MICNISGDIKEPKQKRLRLAEGVAEEGEDEDEGDQQDEKEKVQKQ